MTEKNEAVTIRPATALDAVNIAKLLKLTLGEKEPGRVNDAKMVQWVLSTLDRAFVAVAEHAGRRLVGSIACVPMQPPWSDDWYLGEAWLFALQSSVAPYEQTIAQMIGWAERLADQERLPLMVAAQNADRSKVGLFSNRPGYGFFGRSFMRMPEVPVSAESALAS